MIIARITNALLLIVVLWIISFFVAFAFQCSPVSALWTMTATGRAPFCVSTVPLRSAYTASDVLVNLMLFTLPLPLISGLLSRLSTKQRYAVGGMFALGILVCVTSLARMIVFLQSQHGPDTTIDDTPLAAWSLVEASLGIIVACLPHLSPLIVTSTSGGDFLESIISPSIASSKVTPRMSGWGYLMAQNQADQNEPFDDQNVLGVSKTPRASLKELEADMGVDHNTRSRLHERNDSILTSASAKSGRSANGGFGPPLMTEIKRKAVPQSNDSTPQEKELPRLPWTWNGTVDDDNRDFGEDRPMERSMV